MSVSQDVVIKIRADSKEAENSVKKLKTEIENIGTGKGIGKSSGLNNLFQDVNKQLRELEEISGRKPSITNINSVHGAMREIEKAWANHNTTLAKQKTEMIKNQGRLDQTIRRGEEQRAIDSQKHTQRMIQNKAREIDYYNHQMYMNERKYNNQMAKLSSSKRLNWFQEYAERGRYFSLTSFLPQMIAGQAIFSVLDDIGSNIKATENAKDAMVTYARQLHMTGQELQNYKNDLSSLQREYTKINMTAVGQSSMDLAYRLNLPRKELTLLTETNAVFSDAMARNGRRDVDTALALSDALDGQFRRLQEVGITRRELIKDGWNGNIKDSHSLLLAINKALKEQHYDMMAKEVYNLSDAYKVMVNQLGLMGDALFQGLKPTIQWLLQGIGDLTKRFNELNPAVKSTISHLTAGGLIGFLGVKGGLGLAGGLYRNVQDAQGFLQMITGRKSKSDKQLEALLKKNYLNQKGIAIDRIRELNEELLSLGGLGAGIKNPKSISKSNVQSLVKEAYELGALEKEAGAAGAALKGGGGLRSLATGITGMLTPLLEVSAVIAVMIPVVTGLAAEGAFFIKKLGEFIKWLNFEELGNFAKTNETLKGLATSLGGLGQSMIGITVNDFWAGVDSLINMFSGKSSVGNIQKLTTTLQKVAPYLNSLAKIKIDPQVGTNLGMVSAALSSANNVFDNMNKLAVTWSKYFTNDKVPTMIQNTRTKFSPKNYKPQETPVKGLKGFFDNYIKDIQTITTKLSEANGKIDVKGISTFNQKLQNINTGLDNVKKSMRSMFQIGSTWGKWELNPQTFKTSIDHFVLDLFTVNRTLRSISKSGIGDVGDSYKRIQNVNVVMEKIKQSISSFNSIKKSMNTLESGTPSGSWISFSWDEGSDAEDFSKKLGNVKKYLLSANRMINSLGDTGLGKSPKGIQKQLNSFNRLALGLRTALDHCRSIANTYGKGVGYNLSKGFNIGMGNRMTTAAVTKVRIAARSARHNAYTYGKGVGYKFSEGFAAGVDQDLINGAVNNASTGGGGNATNTTNTGGNGLGGILGGFGLNGLSFGVMR